MSSHCSWQTPLDSNLFPCHGLSGKRSRSSKIMSAAVLEAVSLISKWPCPGISTETDMRQRILCAVQRHELSAACNNTQICRWFFLSFIIDFLLRNMRFACFILNAFGCPGFHVKVSGTAECSCGAGPSWEEATKTQNGQHLQKNQRSKHGPHGQGKEPQPLRRTPSKASYVQIETLDVQMYYIQYYYCI